MSDQHQPEPFPRSGPEERDYLLRRADAHRKIADKTEDPGARAIHLRIQQLYQERAAAIDMVFPT